VTDFGPTRVSGWGNQPSELSSVWQAAAVVNVDRLLSRPVRPSHESGAK
jgi:hypothetical protein